MSLSGHIVPLLSRQGIQMSQQQSVRNNGYTYVMKGPITQDNCLIMS